MKKLTFITLGICAITAAPSFAAPQPVAKVLLAQAQSAQSDKIAQVKDGTLEEARASWWGFDKDDATDALQNAIDSGVPTLIVDNMGSDWIVGKPINLVSDQEIIFEDGVVIQAKKDAFHDKNDSLFQGMGVSNVSLIGQGNATFRMRRADYDNPDLYTKAEWRMGIRLMDTSDITIRNLTVEETGGDGLYLGASSSGYNKNILVEDCHFDNNYRLGAGIISVDGLTIRRTTFNSTEGTNPNSGIDFEPNHAGQRLANIVLEDCEFNDNKNDGLHFYVANLNGDSYPVSITIKRSKISGNKRGMLSSFARGADLDNPVQGTVTIEDCHFDHNQIQLREAAFNGVKYFFNKCTIDNSNEEDENAMPILLSATDASSNAVKIGNITFDNTSVIPGENNQVIALRAQRGVNVADNITGTLLSNGEPFDLAGFVKEQQEYTAKINSLKSANTDLSKLQAPAEDVVRENNNKFYLQGAFTFLQYAEKGQEITVDFRVIKSYNRDTIVELYDPSGEKLESYKLPLNNTKFPVTFTAQETGIYRLVRESTFSQRIDINSSHRGSGLLADDAVRFLTPDGQIYFEVPAGVEEFTVSVSTDSPADVALLDAQGNEVERHDNIGTLQLFTGKRADASQSEIWSLKSSNAGWLTNITLYEPLIPILSTNPATMLRAE